jgi:hypothetical protein
MSQAKNYSTAIQSNATVFVSKLDGNSCCVGLQQTTPMTEPAMTPGDAAPLEEPVTARDGPDGEEGRVEVGVGVVVDVEVGVEFRFELGVG